MTEARSPRGFADRALWLLTTGAGLGMIPVAPGTFGALPGFILVAAVALLPNLALRIVALVFFVLAAVPIASWGERFFGKKDPRHVVIDEIVSLPLTTVFAPCAPAYLAIAFVLNRILDILKPPPAHQSQRLPAGWGIVIDDMFSGLYAGLLLLLVHHFGDAWLAAHLPTWMLTDIFRWN